MKENKIIIEQSRAEQSRAEQSRAEQRYLCPDFWTVAQEGFYVSKDLAVDTAFSEFQQDTLFQIEDGSWWFQYRASVILSLMDQFFKKDRMTLDIGGGNGYTTSQAMSNGYRVGLIEPSMEACGNALARKIPCVCCGSVEERSIRDNSMEQIMLLDVLEHIEHDDLFLNVLPEVSQEGF